MFAARRKRFVEAMEPGSIAILLGAGLATRSRDTHYRFRQDSDFHYLTGFDHPNAALVLQPDADAAFTLFVEPRDPGAETWTGYRPGVEGARSDFGADEAHPIDALLEKLPALLEQARRVYHVLGRDPRVDQKLIETIDAARLRSRAHAPPPDAILDPRAILHEQRLRKEPAEIEWMRRAVEITREAHAAAAALAHAGRFEYELEAALDGTFRRRGGWGPAYDSIVGGGANATVLHYIANDQPLRDDTLVLIDAGCEYAGYAADVTRTYPVGGRFATPAREIYELVLAAQEAALEHARPGATLEQIHDAAVRRLIDGMIALRLLPTTTLDDALESGEFRRYYVHRTSHWLGLDVHDVGAYSQDGKPRPLEPGMVLTVEPGLYVPAGEERAPEALRGIGVRIEDDVLITADGHENLCAAIPKHPSDVEALVRAGRPA
ncbi:aminopeptidase P N-terminal domain-containing protein [Myxococcota bacterium]|nr:aminopeptidase P N-terminal domain-containing protein [Myxococcota bacterium]MCZ7617022.1 aminopeptidase P N-terminal domain-containing protein [Myxococcota bacterium]